MLSAENLAAIESEGRRLVDTVRRGPDRPVPFYEGWSLSDLASHTASIHGRTTLICKELPQERISAPRLPEGTDPADWCEQNLEQMLAALTDADPDAPVWGFSPSPTIAFWERRMVIETGVHRWDAHSAFGEEDRLLDVVAVSGLNEFGDMWLRHLGDVSPLSGFGEDVGTLWQWKLGEPLNEVSGSVSDLYLRLMCRPSPVELPTDWADALDKLGKPPKG